MLRRSSLLIPIQLVFFLFFSFNIHAQGWEKTYPVDGYAHLRTEYITLTQDGGYCLTATVKDPSKEDIAILKLDAEGNQQWLSVIGEVEDEMSVRIYQLDDGGYIIGGITKNNANVVSDWYLLRIDALGNKLWDQSYGSSADEDINAMIPTADNGFLLVGEVAGVNRIFLRKVDSLGVEEWISTLGPTVGYTEARDIKPTSDGGYIITGYTQPLGINPSNDKNFYIVKIDENGTEQWSHKHGGLFNESGEDVVETLDGGYVSTGYKFWDDGDDADMYWVKLNSSGDTLWTKTFGVSDKVERGFTITEAPNGDLVSIGNSVNIVNNEGFGYVVRTNVVGTLLKEKVLTEGSVVGFPSVVLPTSDDGFIIAGTGDSTIALIKTDSDLNSLTISISGNVFYDIDNDCTFDNGEIDLENWIVVADGEGNNDFFDITDANGNYEILSDTGQYDLRVVTPNGLWKTCGPIDLSLNNFFDTIVVPAIPMQAIAECPNMTVELSAPQLVRCFENTYYVKYCNDGTLDEANAFIEIAFDTFLNITTSSLPYTDIGNNTFSFDVGNVAIGACGDFTVNVLVDCDSTELGQTHCVEAHIYPDSICVVPILWDSSSMQVTGICVDDSITFAITNVGVNPPIAPNVVRVIEDDVIVLINIIDLNPNETIFQTFPSTGATLRMEIDQTPGHPGNSHPSATVEGCGVGLGNGSLGFVTQFPMDDGDYFIDIDCQENVGSYDPNDKAAYPKGYFDEHFVGTNDELEYHIRFQNTGTDTARTVILRDTLSQYLDPSTIKFGTSSHAYQAELLNNGIIKITFDNIMLPDSAANLVESNGFFRFTIDQKAGNTPGTVIENSAAIYFDFNEPVITNTVFNTLEFPTNYLVEEIGVCDGDSYMGIEIEADTVLIDTIPNLEAQDVIFTAISFLEKSYSDSAITINSGDIIDGTPIFGDTIIILYETAVNGCDSLQRVDISVDTDDPLGFNPNFRVYPNPTSDIFYINYELAESSIVNITLYDILGQKISTVVKNELQYSGVKSYKIDEKEIIGNVLFVHWQSGNKNFIQKVVITP